jgi:hypothetical protein
MPLAMSGRGTLSALPAVTTSRCLNFPASTANSFSLIAEFSEKKQGFPMKQGVLQPNRVRLLLSEGHSCFRPRRTGERKRKSVRGCIVASDIAVLALVIVKQGEQDIPGLTDTVLPKRYV